MHRINILSDLDQEYFMEKRQTKTNKKPKREKSIKINDQLFDIALRKGLIEKTDDGYVFIGDYEDLQAFKNNKKSLDWILLD
ncbi:MAG: hypothetical protein QHH19_01660 [Candidatus Thermoplasmatota archaeon]|jgi:hypothetical protein|nr:hypothetical protein [Candidatus Thermoplasmatota archaeon]